MLVSRPHFIRLAGAILGLRAVTWSQDRPYPTKVIKVIVPFPAGGRTDLVARRAFQTSI